MLNVYFYRVTSITGLDDTYKAILCDWFTDHVVVPILDIQTDAIIHDGLFFENLTNGVDILSYTTDYPAGGQILSVDTMPPFVAWSFQLLRESRATGNGYKRIGGVPEANVTNGVRFGLDTEIHAVEDALKADIVLGLVTVAEPIILKHPITVPLVSPVYSSIGEAQYKSVGSQNTRKFNRGV